MFAHYERISQIIDGENQTNQINGAVCPINKGQKTLRGRCVPKRIVARRSNVDIRHALHLRKQLGHDTLLFGNVVRISERHLDTVIEIRRDGLDRGRGNILDLAQELARETADVIQAGLDGLGIYGLPLKPVRHRPRHRSTARHRNV